MAFRDVVLCAIMKIQPARLSLSISPDDLAAVKGKNKDGRVIFKPHWGIIYIERVSKSRSFRHHYVTMDDKSLLPKSRLINLTRRINLNNHNSEKDIKDVNQMIFWWLALRDYIAKQIPNIF